MKTNEPLNQILYGPPGTGKTYNTIYKALDILEPLEDGKSWSDYDTEDGRTKALDEFNKLKDEERIIMTTFHQSMSYEDFVEGIKPEIRTDKKGKEKEIVIYKTKDGIFKNICISAQKRVLTKLTCQIKQKIVSFIQKAIEEKIIFKTIKNSFFRIVSMDNSTITITIPGNEKSNSVSVKIQDLELLLSRDPVNTVTDIPQVFNRTKQQYDSYLFALSEQIRQGYYILIIDEINRGNVANVFGELITLIEEDKRLGNKEAATVILPYSQKPFGVPNNLYIIGTMNTADRSVEALDSALRRRFSFTEMMPKPELLKDIHIVDNTGKGEHSLADLLYTINKRIEILKDREHQIGHSYFMKFANEMQVKAEDLQEVFYNKIIPLLQEYFYGDYEQIQKVIGSGFVVKEKEIIPFANTTNESDNSSEDLYKIVSKVEMSDALDKLNIQPWPNA